MSEQLLEGVDEEGFTTTPLLDAADIVRLQEVFDAVRPVDLTGFWSNVASGSDAETNLRVRDAVLSVVWPKVRRLFPTWRPAVTSIVAKGRGPGSEAKPHQDWSLVDERHERALNLWVPLVDVDQNNGTLEVAPGSQRLFFEPRGLALPSPCLEFGGPVERHLRAIPLPAGSALIYPHNLIHGSRENRSEFLRPAIALSVLPADATLIQFWAGIDTPPDRVEVFAVDEDYFYREIGDRLDGSPPSRARMVGHAPRLGAPISADEMLARIEGAT